MRKFQKGEVTTITAILIGALAAPVFNLFISLFEPEPVKPCYYQVEKVEGDRTELKAKWVDDCDLTNQEALEGD